jgi:hypothetical protein
MAELVRRARLKIGWPSGRAGSSPAPGIRRSPFSAVSGASRAFRRGGRAGGLVSPRNPPCNPRHSEGIAAATIDATRRAASRSWPGATWLYVSMEEFTFSSASVGRLASTLHLLLRNRRLALPDDPELLEELANVRLRETSPGVIRDGSRPG